jgi:hypothetical protein
VWLLSHLCTLTLHASPCTRNVCLDFFSSGYIHLMGGSGLFILSSYLQYIENEKSILGIW